MHSHSSRAPLAALVALLGVVGSFAFTTVAVSLLPRTVSIGAACLVACGLTFALYARRGIPQVRKADRTTLALAAAGGIAAFWAAPLLALSQRATSTPSGADVLFLTASVWGLVCVAAAFFYRPQRPFAASLAGAGAAVAGAIALMANWERPSSFSPFAKFPLREALLVVAGMLFAAGALALVVAVRRSSMRGVALVSLVAAAAVGAVFALPALPSALAERGAGFAPAVYMGVSLALFAIGWLNVTDSADISRAATSLLAAPAALVLLNRIESVTVLYGTDPITWPGALAGIAMIAAGVGVIWLAPVPPAAALARPHGTMWAPLGIALAACVAAVGALFTPALNAVAEGGISQQPFYAAWVMIGAESVVGWVAVAAAGLALASVLMAMRDRSLMSWLPSAVAAVAVAAGALPLLGTTIHTWNDWVPAEVQQTYGTEHSQLLIGAHPDMLRTAAFALAVFAVIALAIVVALKSRAPGAPLEDAR